MSNRLIHAMPESELERRRREMRRIMLERELDLLLISSTSHNLGNGYVRYFTDYPAATFPEYLMLPLEGEMTYLAHSSERAKELKTEFGIADTHIGFPGRDYGRDAESVASLLAKRKLRKIGLVFDNLPTSFYVGLVQHLRDVQVLDATDAVDQIRMVKSREEVSLIQKTAEANDAGMEALKRSAAPGKKESEIMIDVQKTVVEAGCEDQFYLLGSAPFGEPIPNSTIQLWSRTVKAGDILRVLIEPQGPGGYYTEITRSVCIGNAPSELFEAHEIAADIQMEIANMFTPGVHFSELFAKYSEMLQENDCAPPGYMLGHSQGLDVVESPEIVKDARAKAEVNMNCSIHPTVSRGKFSITLGDGFLITESGARRLHKTPQELFIV